MKTAKIFHFLSGIRMADSLYYPHVYDKWIQSGHDLYRAYVAPYVPADTRKLLVIPDGPLSHLPFEALITEMPDVNSSAETDLSTLKYLLHKYPVSYQYAAKLRSISQTKNSHKGISFAAFAPAYSGVFPHLSFNQMEGSKIAELMNGTVYKGESATESHFKQFAALYSLIHLAMHTSINDSLPNYSALIFSLPQNKQEDGLLYVSEIYGMELSADLLVLSACQTAVGNYHRGEGIRSIARAFQYAGISSLIMSYWNVNDKSTSTLMKYFYQNLNDRSPKDISLQLAKQKMINDGFAHPYFWSAFVLAGEYDSISSPFWKIEIQPGFVILLYGLILFLISNNHLSILKKTFLP